MNPQLAVAITAKNQTKPVFDQVVADANKAGAAMQASGNRASAAMNSTAFATGNVAAQLNDIGVMMASGQSPLILAIQQGTQLNQIFAGMSGPQVLGLLKTAFLSLINPISLITIGSIAAGAALFQMVTSARQFEAIEASLKAQREGLDEVISGYEEAEAAVRAYRERAGLAPVAEVRSDTVEQQKRAQEGLTGSIQATLSAYQDYTNYIREYAQGAYDVEAALAQAEALEAIRDAAARANPDLDAVVLSLKDFIRSDPYFVLKNSAEQMLVNAEAARKFAVEVDASARALDNLPDDIVVRLNLKMDGFTEAQSDLLSLMPDFRSEFDRLRDQAEEAFNRQRSNASDGPTRAQAQKDYRAVLDGIAEAERRASVARGSSAGTADRQVKAYEGVIANLDHELELLGKTAVEQEILTNIRAAGVDLGSAEAEMIRKRTEELYAQNEAMAETERQQKAMTEMWESYGEIGQSAVRGLVDILKDGKIEADEWINLLARIGDNFIDLAMNSLFSLFGAGPKIGGNGFFPGLKMASGGRVEGPGTSTSDSIPALLSRGEFVVNADAASRFGSILELMNAGASFNRLSEGGWALPGGTADGAMLLRRAA